jgi:uncharacterized protein
MSAMHTISDLPSLTALFGAVGEASRRKEVDHLHPIYQQWITASPFAVLATTGPDGLDASPRGDPASLVTIVDAHTLLLPERRGNNRVDSLRNILHDPRVALLFFIPGVGETLRVGGVARITKDPALLQQLAHEGKPPVCVVEIKVQTVFFQCARAIVRSSLWGPKSTDTASKIPTAGAILAALTNAQIDGVAYDRELPARIKSTLY